MAGPSGLCTCGPLIKFGLFTGIDAGDFACIFVGSGPICPDIGGIWFT